MDKVLWNYTCKIDGDSGESFVISNGLPHVNGCYYKLTVCAKAGEVIIGLPDFAGMISGVVATGFVNLGVNGAGYFHTGTNMVTWFEFESISFLTMTSKNEFSVLIQQFRYEL